MPEPKIRHTLDRAWWRARTGKSGHYYVQGDLDVAPPRMQRLLEIYADEVPAMIGLAN